MLNEITVFFEGSKNKPALIEKKIDIPRGISH